MIERCGEFSVCEEQNLQPVLNVRDLWNLRQQHIKNSHDSIMKLLHVHKIYSAKIYREQKQSVRAHKNKHKDKDIRFRNASTFSQAELL